MSRRLSALALGLVLMAAPAAAETLSSEQLAAGRKLYVRKCARCHRLYEPGAYTSAAWEEWMGKMRRKARLKEPQYTQLLRYLQSLSAPEPSATK